MSILGPGILTAALLATAAAPPPRPTAAPPALASFTVNYRAGDAGSTVDLSFLLDAPAGAHGFVHPAGPHFVDDRGRRVRFWGVNITDWSPGSTQIPSKADAPIWAAALARYGVNIVRLQFLDFGAPRGLIDPGRPDTRRLDPDQLDREDFFLAELRKRGIYIDFNLLVGREWKAGDGISDPDRVPKGDKGVSMYDARMIALQKEYAAELLGHRNPYTGLTYAEDPGVAFVEINNENAIFVGFHAPSPFYAAELERLYNAWLQAHLTADAVAGLRQAAGVAANAPVPLMADKPQEIAASSPRYRAEAGFFDDLQRAYFDGMRDDLRGRLGVRAMILGTADHNHAASGLPIIRADLGMDAIDGHDYWQHPNYRQPKAPMVNDPENSIVTELARTAVAGKPYTVSEVNEAFPNDWGGEGIPLLAAYGAFQDWDAIIWYTFEPKKNADAPAYVGDPFDISLDPMKMPELAAGALLFLRGDVAPARTTVARSYSRGDALESARLPETARPGFDPRWPLDLPMRHEVRIASLDAAASVPAAVPAQPAGALVSDTGQLTWHRAPEGYATLDAPASQALVGFLPKGAAIGNLRADLVNPFASLMLSSLTAAPIARSERLLLVAGGAVENSGFKWNGEGYGPADIGHAPSLVQPVTGTLTLVGLAGARAVAVQPLDGSGRALGLPQRATRAGDGWRFAVGAPVTTWYAITVSR